MRPQKQLFHHRPAEGIYGDCYRTAIACILDLSPDEVPHQHKEQIDGEQRQLMEEWLRGQNLCIAAIIFEADPEVVLDTMKNLNPQTIYILSGFSRTGVNHSVVCRGGEIIWDPSLTDAGIVGRCDDGYTWVEFLAVRG